MLPALLKMAADENVSDRKFAAIRYASIMRPRAL
jgi:hypothetical protein